MKVISLKPSIKKDMLGVIGPMCRLNAPGAMGYLFNPANSGKAIANGMYCDHKDEINADQWTYYHNFKDGITYKI
jgi:hypothetical protein